MNPYEKELSAAQAYGRFMERRVQQLEEQVRTLLKEKAGGLWGSGGGGGNGGGQNNQNNTTFANHQNGSASPFQQQFQQQQQQQTNINDDVSSVAGSASVRGGGGGGGGMNNITNMNASSPLASRARGSSMASNNGGTPTAAATTPYGNNTNTMNMNNMNNSASSNNNNSNNAAATALSSFADNFASLGSGVNVVEELIRLREENELLRQHYRQRVADINELKLESDEATQREAKLVTLNEQLKSEMVELREILPARLFGERPKDDRKTREIISAANKIRMQYEADLAALSDAERLAKITGIAALAADTQQQQQQPSSPTSTTQTSSQSQQNINNWNTNSNSSNNNAHLSPLGRIAASQQQQQQQPSSPLQQQQQQQKLPTIKLGFKKVAKMYGTAQSIIAFLQNETLAQRTQLLQLMHATSVNAESMSKASEAAGPVTNPEEGGGSGSGGGANASSSSPSGGGGNGSLSPRGRSGTTTKRGLFSSVAASMSGGGGGGANANQNNIKAIRALAATAIALPTDPNWRLENMLFFASHDEGLGRATQLLDSVSASLENIKLSARAIDETITNYNVAARHGVSVIVQAQSCSTRDECAIVKQKAEEVIQTLNNIRAMRKEAVEVTRALLPTLAIQFRQVSNALLGAMTRRIIGPRVSRPVITQLELLSLKCQTFDTSSFISPDMLNIRVGAVEQVLLEVILGIKRSDINLKDGTIAGEGEEIVEVGGGGNAEEDNYYTTTDYNNNNDGSSGSNRHSSPSPTHSVVSSSLGGRTRRDSALHLNGAGISVQSYSSGSQFFERMEVAEIRALSNDVVKPPLFTGGGGGGGGRGSSNMNANNNTGNTNSTSSASASTDIAFGFVAFADRCLGLLNQTRDLILGRVTGDEGVDATTLTERNTKGTQYNFFNTKKNELTETEKHYQTLVTGFLDARAIEREAAEEVKIAALTARANNLYPPPPSSSSASASHHNNNTNNHDNSYSSGGAGGGASHHHHQRTSSPALTNMLAAMNARLFGYNQTAARSTTAYSTMEAGKMSVIMREKAEQIAARRFNKEKALQHQQQQQQGNGSGGAEGDGHKFDDGDGLVPYDPNHDDDYGDDAGGEGGGYPRQQQQRAHPRSSTPNASPSNRRGGGGVGFRSGGGGGAADDFASHADALADILSSGPSAAGSASSPSRGGGRMRSASGGPSHRR